MKTTILILTIQLVAVMKIFIVYFGLYELESYLGFVNTVILTTYSITALFATLMFLKGLMNERRRKAITAKVY